MKQKKVKPVKKDASNRVLKRERSPTRVSIKQEIEDSKEYLKCALYSPLKTESSPLKLKEYEKCSSTKTLQSLSTGTKNKHCGICDITFSDRARYLDHELHVHKTKEKTIIDLENLCCNICFKRFRTIMKYRNHMNHLNNVRVPLLKPKRKPKPKPNPLKTPDIENPNNYCISCDFTSGSRSKYYIHLVKFHQMSHLRLSITIPVPKNRKPTIDILNLYCNVCNRVFDSKRGYITHLVRLHEVVLPDSYSEPSNFDSESCYCKACDMKYKTKVHFNVHLRNIHRTELPSPRPGLIPDAYDQDNYCIACDKGFCSKSSYICHLVSHHDKIPELLQGRDCETPSTADILYKRYCADCRKLFLQKDLYYIHVDTIDDIKPVEYLPNDDYANTPNHHCNSCNRNYSNSAHYRFHLKSVHNLRKLCTITNSVVANSDIKPVLDVLNKNCNVCDKTFKTLNSYRHHMFNFHQTKLRRAEEQKNSVNRNEVPVIDEIRNYCSACDNIYTSRKGYRSHLRRIHDIQLRDSIRIVQEITLEVET